MGPNGVLAPGDDVQGNSKTWQIITVLPAGGCGQLYLVEDERQQEGILKVLLPQHAGKPHVVQQFLNEAEWLIQMGRRSDHTVKLLDDGTLPEPAELPFLVMEYVAGGSLRDHVRNTKGLSERQVLRFGHQIAGALAATHRPDKPPLDVTAEDASGTDYPAGLIHRDVTPANILLDRDAENVKLGDFGSAIQIIGDDAANVPYMLTREFASPEQTNVAAKIKGTSDVYQLGGCLFWALTGVEPTEITDGDFRSRLPRPNSKLADLIVSMTRPHESDRPSAAEVHSELKILSLTSGPEIEGAGQEGLDLPEAFTPFDFITRLVALSVGLFLLGILAASVFRTASQQGHGESRPSGDPTIAVSVPSSGR